MSAPPLDRSDDDTESPSMGSVRPVHIDDMRMALQDLFIDGDWSKALVQDAGYDGEASAEVARGELILTLDNLQMFKISIIQVY